MALSKKEAAQKFLDALETENIRSKRLKITIVVIIIIGGAIAATYSPAVGLGVLVLLAVILQFAHERMGNSIAAAKLEALKSLGWTQDALEQEDLVEKLTKIANK